MKRRSKGHFRRNVILILSMELLLIIGMLAYIKLRPMVKDTVTLEAGTDNLDIEEFLINKKDKGSFITDVQDIDLNQIGSYKIEINVRSKKYTSRLEIVDTTAPTATVRNMITAKNEKLPPEKFVSGIVDKSEVTVFYKEAPDMSIPGEKEVTLILEDSSKNRTELKAILTVLDIKGTVTVEAGSSMNVTVDDFVDTSKYNAQILTDLTALDISKPGVHEIRIKVDSDTVTAHINAIDTTAPSAVFTDLTAWKGEPQKPDAFVSQITDASNVTAEYETEPDFTKIGDQQVTILLKDAVGNTTSKQVKLSVGVDTEPPKIIGAADKTVYIGEGVTYRKGVTVTDNKDNDLKVSVDSSEVDLKKPGAYQVTYTAKDLAGNKAKLTITVTVVEYNVTEETVNKAADEVLANICNDKMTKLEKAAEIYKWTKSHVNYTGDSDKTNWLAEAFRGIKKGVGDCFTYYAVARALLTRAGIDNMQVTRLGGTTHHYWNLVNCGDGWYHFDSCRNKDHADTFMLTDKELEKFTKTRGKYYYNRDMSLYPATSEKPCELDIN